MKHSFIKWQKIICVEPNILKKRIKNPFRAMARKGAYDIAVWL